ncbi:MAG TPA: 50S ribosomal protein L17 [candidate division Zixibacteria bacterium]|nr:50S ribosomal protein L17 [candidate division Zixibacteria bacterium]
MRHGKKIHKLNRPAEHRKAVLNNLAMALITRKQIQTTEAKAKALKPYIDRLISTARQDTLSARRRVAQYLPNKEAFKELFNNVIPKLEGRTSGFSRIVKYKNRRGDGAPMSIVQLLLEGESETKGRKKGKKKAAAAAAPAAKKAKKEKEPEPEKSEEPEPEETEAEEEKSPVEKGEAQAAVAEEAVTKGPEEGSGEEAKSEPEEGKPEADKSEKKK